MPDPYGLTLTGLVLFQNDELDDVDYRSVEDYGHDPEGHPEEEDEDEKVLEELEDKQLLARISAIEADHNIHILLQNGLV